MNTPEVEESLGDLEGYEPSFDSTDGQNEVGGANGSQRGPVGPDSSSQLVELAVDDFPLYFSERDGRLYQSSIYSPYPLPVDTAEQERLNVLHRLLDQQIGPLYVSLVDNVIGSRPALVLDLCTGTGKWVMEMAARFPRSFFRGVDIVPIATRYPPANVQFEMHDVNNPLRWDTSSVDVVHVRDAWMAVNDFRDLLDEAARMLRPGGLFISCEWGQDVMFHPEWPSSPFRDAPHSRAFFSAVKESFHIVHNISPIGESLPSLLADSSLFRNVTPQVFYMPIGPWHQTGFEQDVPVGRAYRACLKRYADSVRSLLYDGGLDSEAVEILVNNFKEEIVRVSGQIGGLVCPIYTVHATRV